LSTFLAVFKLQKIHQEIFEATTLGEKMKLYDKMGDITCLTGVFSSALKNYHKMVRKCSPGI
jgi:hypothetical protein